MMLEAATLSTERRHKLDPLIGIYSLQLKVCFPYTNNRDVQATLSSLASSHVLRKVIKVW